MQITTNKHDMERLIAQVVGVSQNGGMLEILGHLLFRVVGGKITATANDLEVEISHTADVQHEGAGAFTVPGKHFATLIQKIAPDATIRIQIEERCCTLRAGRGKYVMQGLSAEDYPAMTSEYPDEVEVPAKQLSAMLRYVQPSMGVKDIRYYLNGALLDLRADALVVVATDGHRLSVDRVPMTNLQPKEILIPNSTVRLICLLCDAAGDAQVWLRISDKGIEMESGDYRLRSRLIDGKFPEYQRMIQTDHQSNVSFATADMRAALLRLGIFADKKYNGVHLKATGGEILLKTSSGHGDDGEERLEVQGDWNAEFGIRLSYLLDAMEASQSERVQVWNQENQALHIIPEDASQRMTLIMPMRL